MPSPSTAQHADEATSPLLFSQDDTENAPIPFDNTVHIASKEEKKQLWIRNALVNALFIAGWFLFGTSLSVYNKWMFSSDHMNFPFPLFVTSLHMLVQFFLSGMLRLVLPKYFRPERSPDPGQYGKKVFPTAVATSLDIGLSNLSLKTISLSFYTMCKSSSLIFVLLFAFLFRLEKFSWRLIGVITLIFSGVLLMVATETHFILHGFLLVITASALGGLRWGLAQLLLQNKTLGLDNPAATIFWLSPSMAVTLAIISLVIEGWSAVFSSDFFSSSQIFGTLLYLTAPGVLAFCMVMSEFYIIQRTGMVPMSIAGIAKEVTTISLSAWFFGDELTPLNITGVGITVCGIILFTYHKYRKSVNSPLPLDAHGNPITPDDDSYGHGQYVRLDDTQQINSRVSEEEYRNHPRPVHYSTEEDDLESERGLSSPTASHPESGSPNGVEPGKYTSIAPPVSEDSKVWAS